MIKIHNLTIKAAEFCQRRLILAENILKQSKNKNHLIIFSSSEVQYKSRHIPRVYHQDTYFRYYSGFPQKKSILLIKINQDKVISSLFIDRPSSDDILWNGPYPSEEEAKAVSGVDEVRYDEEWQIFLEKELRGRNPPSIWTSNGDRFSSKEASFNKNKDVNKIADFQRVIKSSTEIDILRASGKITSDALKKTMAYSRPSMDEHHLLGKFHYEVSKCGGKLAYPPVIAGGSRANIIHYLEGDRVIHDGELVLVDIGSDIHGYYSDVTRTWPINGRFSAAQSILYDILYRIHEDCIKECTSERSLNDMLSFMYGRMSHYLIEQGIVKDEQKVESICPHHIGHYLGLDIHDTPSISSSVTLSPGMVFPLEPGLYFQENCDFVDPIFRGIGMRLEDDFFMTNSGTVECLTSDLPRSRIDIENQCNSVSL